MNKRLKGLLTIENRDTVERWARSHASAVAMVPAGLTLCRVLGEFMMVVDLEDLSVAPHLAMDGYWELWNTICIARHVKPGWACVDVGANFGYYSLLLAALTDGPVDAWEPAKDLTRLIDKSAKLNGLRDQVRIVHAAASDSERPGKLLRSMNDFGSCSVDEMREGETTDPFTINHSGGSARLPLTFQRLDKSGVVPDFVKIDAEGHEPAIWRGMQGFFESEKPPRAMLMEWTPSRYELPGEFLEEIRGRGYDVHVVDAAGGLQKPVGDITAIEGHLDLWLAR